MSKQIRIEDDLYKDLSNLRQGRQTFSDVIADLLSARLRIFQILTILEGQLKFQEWKSEQIQKQIASQSGGDNQKVSHVSVH